MLFPVVWSFLTGVVSATGPEVFVKLPKGGLLGLSTRGSSAFRVRMADGGDGIVSPMIQPDLTDATFDKVESTFGIGISTVFGSIVVSAEGVLSLMDSRGRKLTTSLPIAISKGKLTEILLSSVDGVLYGKGAGGGDAQKLTTTKSSASVANTKTYTPYYYTTDGYAALGVVSKTQGTALPVGYSRNRGVIKWWAHETLELYLMPSETLDLGTQAYYALVGSPRVPPRYAFGFLACRWGWTDQSYIESVLHKFRNDSYPVDAFIADFGWFTTYSDYKLGNRGSSTYHDFGWNSALFLQPQEQLSVYYKDLHFRFGGIRKPRLGNNLLLDYARGKGWMLSGRNLNFTSPLARDWYAHQQLAYLQNGVKFFWNDEGETDYFTFHWWNTAQLQSLRLHSNNTRLFSINRAWSPGIARFGVSVWTGDINPTWNDLANTPGYVLNWGLGGAPYVTCDIGGFHGETNGKLLTRWLQVGAFMPVMRVHSQNTRTPHWPWLWNGYSDTMRQALNLRYQLVPYHYSFAHKMFETRQLAMRPLVAEFPMDKRFIDFTAHWFDGELLVAPILKANDQKDVHLPEGDWYAFNSSHIISGPTDIDGTASIDDVPVFVRSGTIVPLAPVVQYTDALPGGPLEVQIYPGANATFTLVEDDGETIAYESGSVRKTHFSWNETSMTLSWKVESGIGLISTAFTELYVKVFFSRGVRQSPRSALAESGSIAVPFETNGRFFV